jgi:hypothetical protein
MACRLHSMVERYTLTPLDEVADTVGVAVRGTT